MPLRKVRARSSGSYRPDRRVDHTPIRLTIPGRLRPYLDELYRHGLHGITLRKVVIGCVERQLQQEVARGWIQTRVNGRPRGFVKP